MILIILQNAYGVEDGYIPSYEKLSFANSYTGKRLREVIPDGEEIQIRNASPIIGKDVDSLLKPDVEYLRQQIEIINPDKILACGKSARNAINQIDVNIPIITMPHPAYRALSKKMTLEIKNKLLNI